MSLTTWFHGYQVYDTQYFEEDIVDTNADDIYTPGSGTDAKFISKAATLSLGVSPGITPVYGGYGRRPYAIETTVDTCGIALDFPLRSTESITFLDYLVNAPDGAGTCNRALSLVTKMTDGSKTYYFSVKHARPLSGAIIYASGILSASIRFSCHYNAFSTTIPTNWQIAADPGVVASPFIHSYDGGADCWTIAEQNGPTSYNPVVEGAVLRFNNTLDIVPDGTHRSGWSDNPVSEQHLSGAITIAAKSTSDEWKAFWDGIYAGYYWDIDWTILPGTHTFAADDVKFESPEIPAPSRIGPRALPLTIVSCLGPVVLA
uniref:Uncharacterized protein n=1 Tax=viral metagenome TaxID=1070528 RepID=A0A6M3JME7_9ZZZZ